MASFNFTDQVISAGIALSDTASKEFDLSCF
jgi:hypothetical protein